LGNGLPRIRQTAQAPRQVAALGGRPVPELGALVGVERYPVVDPLYERGIALVPG